jgi:hypothetical protein
MGNRAFNLKCPLSPGSAHNRLTHKFQGLDARLTGVEPAKIIHPILA